MAYWLIKSEPEECGLTHFIAASDQGIPWDGVRNYQARNFIRAMQLGDRVLLYHSSCQRADNLSGITTLGRRVAWHG